MNVTEPPARPYAAMAVGGTIGFAMGYLFVSWGFPDDSVSAVLVGAFFALSWAAIAAAVNARLGELLSYLFYGGVWLRRRSGVRSQRPREGP